MSNPGSYNEFISQNGLEPGPEAIWSHSEALQAYRVEIARERGLDLDELHTAKIDVLTHQVMNQSVESSL